ncbi:MAG: hypothetical protein EOP88_11770 [Verrucomicrobiaceae bacterium]|nr:MAG: hypothetical protein EOP88_11770 [Verrucomicrobiaceae bacterium]
MKFPAWRVFIPLVILSAQTAGGVICLDTADPSLRTSTPGDNSGWQYEGKFKDFLGVPIAPHFFITATHIGGAVGDVLDFHGDPYTTIAKHNVPSTDLTIWEVNHAKPFPTYAPLSSGAADVGSVVTVIGRGTQRGTEVIVGGESKGWQWGVTDKVQRWGRNTVAGVQTAAGFGQLLYCDFDSPGLPDECHLSNGDSGGGMFVLEGGLWRLAGINFSVDGPFREPPAGASFNATLFDAGGLEFSNGPGWTLVPEGPADVASSFYCSRISHSLAFISNLAPAVNSLATEDYPAWQKLYFTPAEIGTPADTGPLADFDHDGLFNLLEFALNLDPSFNETTTMTPATGLRGTPFVQVETVGGDERVTIEFVRRTAGSGAGLTYEPRFSSDLETTWQPPASETVTPINSRWERVKAIDPVTSTSTDRRFARVAVTLGP